MPLICLPEVLPQFPRTGAPFFPHWESCTENLSFVWRLVCVYGAALLIRRPWTLNLFPIVVFALASVPDMSNNVDPKQYHNVPVKFSTLENAYSPPIRTVWVFSLKSSRGFSVSLNLFLPQTSRRGQGIDLFSLPFLVSNELGHQSYRGFFLQGFAHMPPPFFFKTFLSNDPPAYCTIDVSGRSEVIYPLT